MEPVEDYPIPLPDPHFIDSSDEVSLAVYDFGGDGPDILFAHATGFCAGVFLPIIRRLNVGRVAAIDVRGHGRSTPPATSMDWNSAASDIHAAVSHLGLDAPIGVGHSMGGALLVLAEQARPGTLRSMWLFEPIIFPKEFRSTPGENPLVSGARRRRATFSSAQVALDNFASKPPLNALDPEALRAYIRDGFSEYSDGSVTLRCKPETESATYEYGIRHDAFERLKDVAIAVTVVRGKETPMSPSLLAPFIADHLRFGSLEEHHDLGHFGPLEDPARMAESIGLTVTASA